MARIVVIDDEPSIRRALNTVLTRAGHQVLLAGSSSEGIGLCLESTPDLVITDIHMPGADGFETIAGLRAMHPRLPIMAISGGGETTRLELLGSAKLLGAVLSLKKPFTVRELLDGVGRALANGSQAKQA